MHRGEKIKITLMRLMESEARGRFEKYAALEEYKLSDAERSAVLDLTYN